MEGITEAQRQQALNNLLKDSELDIKKESTIIDSPTSEEYKMAFEETPATSQQGIAEYAEAYISLGKFYVGKNK